MWRTRPATPSGVISFPMSPSLARRPMGTPDTQQFGPIQRTGNGEIVSASPPTKLQGRAEVMGGEFRYTYRLESVDEGTRFTHTNEVRWGGPIRIMHSIQQRMTQRIMDRQLQTLKELLEKKRG